MEFRLRMTGVLSCLLLSILAWPALGADDPAKVIVRVGGSNSLVESAELWGKEFSQKNPNVVIVAQGGGTPQGFRRLFDKEVDVVFASQQITDEEKSVASKSGLTLDEVFVAMGGICMVCNSSLPIEALTKDQIQRLFTGEAKSWQELGGPDLPVKVILREERKSDTTSTFRQRMLDGRNYSQDAVQVATYHRLLNHVTEDKGAIGVIGCLVLTAMDHKVKIFAYKKSDDSPPVKSSSQAFKDGSYPIARPLYFYWDAKSPNVRHYKDFAEFCSGKIWQ